MEQPAPATSEAKLEILSLIAFICAVVAVVLGFWVPWVNWALIVAAIVLAIIGLVRFKKEPGKWKGKGFAIAALIIVGVGIVLGIIFGIVLAGAMMMLG